MNRFLGGRLFVGGALVLLLSCDLLAQARATGADLKGTVRDVTGAPLTNSTITITNLDTNVSRTAASNSDGQYVVPGLAPGPYTATASAVGFGSQKSDRVVLTIGQSVDIDFVLHLAAIADTITVTAPIVSTTRLEIGSTITQDQIQSLPTNGRNFIGFATLAPGVVPDHTPLQGASATSGLSFTGQRARSNNIMVDGLDNNDVVVGSVRATFSQEAVREFQVLANSYSAEFGKASGGVLNIVTKSGTNAVHSSAFLFFRDTALNARGYFDRFDVFGQPVSLEKAPFRQANLSPTEVPCPGSSATSIES